MTGRDYPSTGAGVRDRVPYRRRSPPRASRRSTITTAICYAILAAALALALTGCGTHPCDDEPTADRWIDGIGVRFEAGAAEWTHDASFDVDFLAAVDAGAAYAGTDRAAIRGWVFTFYAPGSVECEEAPDHLAHYRGCYSPGGAVSLSTEGGSVANGPLVHEILHIVIQDTCHTDPRWLDFVAPAKALGTTPGHWREKPSC